ncbi:hypothetical protein FSB78_03695 [Sphingomonas ginsenosidivorax]|uniref:Uncharacterized protein n=1 Tax=Sphingomonas ginsenosidivorax TaxID=862135 RepID=A0A5C6UBQ1_9SPHN|nr:hypothetical protein [Sphingomonas ginsenosidivorax]TXC70149.1 hypothetical protein FSB78_03695 [Sphingomonas ginsenosidivorax]
MKKTLTLSAALLMFTGCSQDRTVYPSLGARPVEKLGFGEPEVKVAVAVPDPALDAEIAGLSKQLATITAGFDKDARSTETAARAARGGAVGSDAWLTAQTLLAGLDDWRAQSSALVGDIEQRATDRAAKLEPDYPALSALRDKAQAETDRQSATIARIQATLPAA